jgi:hypothetical protein
MNETVDSGTKAHATRAVEDLMTVGKAWARYGLTVGKMALETSATTLSKTAGWLGELAQTLAQKDETKSEDQPASNDRTA